MPPLRIVIDPGHTPAQGGALGIRGLREVRYNDALAAGLCVALEAAGFRARLTRAPDRKSARTSAPPRPTHGMPTCSSPSITIPPSRSTRRGSRPARWKPIARASRSPAIRSSSPGAMRVSRAVTPCRAPGRRLGPARPPSGPASCRADPGREPRTAGPRARHLSLRRPVVLRKTEMPAVLLEAGVIVDAGDEAYVSDEANQRRMVAAIVAAVRAYAADAADLPAAGPRVPRRLPHHRRPRRRPPPCRLPDLVRAPA